MSTEINMGEKPKRLHIGLTGSILIALGLGLLCGVIFHYLVPAGTVRDDVFVNGIFYIVGQGFIRLMQMLVVPLVFCSIVCGASSIGDTKTLGTIGLKTLAFYLCTTALAVTVALTIGNLINPGRGVDMSSMVASDTSALSGSANTDVSFTDTLLNIIPKNPIQALASGDMLAIIFFALFVGIILSTMGRKVEVVHRFFGQFNDIMMKMTSMVMYVAPIGVFCLLARTFANIGFDAFLPMVKYMLGVLLALAVQCLVVYMLLLTVFARVNPVKFLKKFVSVMMFAFSTATSNATIPLNIETLEKKMGVDRRISSFTIPLGATINMDGAAITITIMTLAAANTLGIQVSLPAAIVLSAMSALGACGASGVAGGSLLLIPMACSLFGISNDVAMQMVGVGFIIGVVQDSVETALNSAGDVEFAATAEYHQWRKQGKALPGFLAQ